MHRKLRSVFVLVGVLVAATATFAQKKPDFSGRWVVISPADQAGNEQSVKQDLTTLTTQHDSEGGGHDTTYKLDGSENRGVIRSHDEDLVTLSKAMWDGDKLSITSATTYPGGRKVDSKQVWSLNAEGQLVIEVTLTIAGNPPVKMTLLNQKK